MISLVRGGAEFFLSLLFSAKNDFLMKLRCDSSISLRGTNRCWKTIVINVWMPVPFDELTRMLYCSGVMFDSILKLILKTFFVIFLNFTNFQIASRTPLTLRSSLPPLIGVNAASVSGFCLTMPFSAPKERRSWLVLSTCYLRFVFIPLDAFPGTDTLESLDFLDPPAYPDGWRPDGRPEWKNIGFLAPFRLTEIK